MDAGNDFETAAIKRLASLRFNERNKSGEDKPSGGAWRIFFSMIVFVQLVTAIISNIAIIEMKFFAEYCAPPGAPVSESPEEVFKC